MATKRQIEEQDAASEARRHEAVGAIIEHANTGEVDNGRGIAVGILGALADAIDGEAADVRELRRKGWQSAANTLDETVTVIKGWRDLLVGYTPPAGPKPPTGDDIPRNHGAASPADLEQRLVDAFGPELAPTRHIRTTIEPRALEPGASVADGPAYGRLCGATTGSFTHPGGANCEECHRIYAEQQGQPYAGPMAFGNTVPKPTPFIAAAAAIKIDDVDVTGDVAAVNLPPRRDEPVTPAVARAIREEIERDTESVERAIAEGRGPAGILNLGNGSFAMNTSDARPTVLSPGTPVVFVGPITDGEVPAPLNIVEPTAPAVRPRMTAAQVREHGQARQRGAEHRSVSQVESIGDCGTRYALSDLERPAWWNVGGKALHRAVETINRGVAHPGAQDAPIGRDTETLFLQAFDAEIADQHAATPEHPMSTWRAGDRGRENYDWWRVEGPIMVQRWVAWLSRMLVDGWTIATGPTGAPVIEYETRLDVGVPVPNLSIIDLALLHQQQNVLLIVDAKAGKSAPKDPFQLGVYGWALLAAGVAGFMPSPDLANVRGAYWRARTGETSIPVGQPPHGWSILQMYPWPDVVQRYRDADALDRNAIYIPNVTNFCGGCGVADLCPAKAST